MLSAVAATGVGGLAVADIDGPGVTVEVDDMAVDGVDADGLYLFFHQFNLCNSNLRFPISVSLSATNAIHCVFWDVYI